jgi:hypothetical protein
MGTYLIFVSLVVVGIAYLIFSRISSQAYSARPFDKNHPPSSPARYLLKVHRELYPKSLLPGVCKLCGVIAGMVLVAALFAFMR